MDSIARLVVGFPPPASEYDADIIILTRDRLKDTLAAVDSALGQQQGQFHVSVLDQGSASDCQAAYIEAFRDRPRLGYYVTVRNLGVGGGRNFLSSLGCGRLIVALDNDAVFADPLTISRALGIFAFDPRLGALGFKILARDGVGLDEFSWGYPSALKSRAHQHFPTTTFVGAGHAIRRVAWTAAGGYDSDFFFTWEEYDFSLRAIALGWSVVYAGSLAVIHKVSPEARVQWSSERMQLFVRNRLVIARRWNVSWPALCPRIAGYLLKAIRNGRFRPACRGLLEAIRMDRSLLRRPMPPAMRRYIHDNEVVPRGSLVLDLWRHLVPKMPPEQGRFDGSG